MVMHFSKVGYVFNLKKSYPYFNATNMGGGRDGVQILNFLTSFFFFFLFSWRKSSIQWRFWSLACVMFLLYRELMGRIREAEMQYCGRIWWA